MFVLKLAKLTQLNWACQSATAMEISAMVSRVILGTSDRNQYPPPCKKEVSRWQGSADALVSGISQSPPGNKSLLRQPESPVTMNISEMTSYVSDYTDISCSHTK